MTTPVLLHAVGGTAGTRLAALLGRGLEPIAPLGGAVGCLPRIPARVSGPGAILDPLRAGLPTGPAGEEALAVRVRREGIAAGWGEPVVLSGIREVLELCRTRGRGSIEVVRRDPSLLSGLQVGAWFDAPWRTRALRGPAAARIPAGISAALGPRLRTPRWLAAVADLAFWAGVREDATPAEWRRLTGRSYAALVYHRFAGERKPGQERIDIAPSRFARQLRVLGLAGFAPCRPEDLVAFHDEALSAGVDRLPRRCVAITVDDGSADCLAPLTRHARWRPQLYVPTQEVGGQAHWMAGEPVATWEQLRRLASHGIAVGSHARHHERLTALGAAGREAELAGSLAELRQELPAPLPVLAYPYGDHDAALCDAARSAGYAAAFTTAKGRNGAGTDPHCLRRVSVHARDGALAVLWKATTGEGLPASWLRFRAAADRARGR